MNRIRRNHYIFIFDFILVAPNKSISAVARIGRMVGNEKLAVVFSKSIKNDRL